MTTSDNIRSRLAPWLTAIGPRGGLALLIGVHLVTEFFQSHSALESSLRESLGLIIFQGAANGMMAGQWALIGVLAAIGGGRWYLRLGRCMLLVLWLNLAFVAGSHILAEGRDLQTFDELLILSVIGCAGLAVPPLIFRMVVRRAFALTGQRAGSRFQFGLAHLLLLTAEVAGLLALMRATIRFDRNWGAWLRDVLGTLDQIHNFHEWPILAFVLGIIVPPALVACWPKRRGRKLFFLLVYEYLFAIVAALLLAWAFGGDAIILSAHACAYSTAATATIWLTIECVRLLGYDFLPLPRRGAGGGGRQSSEATSAA